MSVTPNLSSAMLLTDRMPAMGSGRTDLSQRLALDVQGVDNLRLQARTNPQAAAKQAAQQFEALFMQMMLKSMRQASEIEGGDLLDSNDSQLFRGMLDQQRVQQMAAGQGIGLADMMLRQLGMSLPGAMPALNPDAQERPLLRQPGVAASATAARAANIAGPLVNATAPMTLGVDFARQLRGEAQVAGARLGVNPDFLVAHAALETGWGKRELRYADGTTSHNLFGIKASPGWQGKTVDALTTEYVGGVPQKRVETFRAYNSYAESFNDYARLVSNSPRYAGALNQGDNAAGFANALAQGGYATDPNYAQKLLGVIKTAARG